VRDDKDVRAAVITGAGEKAFSSGADLKSYITRKAELDEFWQTQKGMLLNRGLEVWKPVVAAVNGYCLAGGMTLLLATDIRIAVSHATFSLAEVKRGIIAGNGGTQRIMAQLPHAIAMEMLLTGNSIDAGTAARWGLVNQVVEPEHLLDTAMDYAQQIARNAPLAVQAAKELAIKGPEMGLQGGLRFEQTINKILMGSEDAREGVLAFKEKRAPMFRGA
jgi:E-phenylitaconyl-CoA hydratase